MIDSILASVNLNGTIRGNVVPNANQHNTWDLGSNAVRFKDAYFAGTIYGDGSNLTGINTGDTIGNFTLSASVIDTDDSSAITITPAVVMNSDLTVENSLTVNGDINSEGVGIPELFSESEIKTNRKYYKSCKCHSECI